MGKLVWIDNHLIWCCECGGRWNWAYGAGRKISLKNQKNCFAYDFLYFSNLQKKRLFSAWVVQVLNETLAIPQWCSQNKIKAFQMKWTWKSITAKCSSCCWRLASLDSSTAFRWELRNKMKSAKVNSELQLNCWLSCDAGDSRHNQSLCRIWLN